MCIRDRATAFGAIGTPVLVLAKETNLDVLNLSTNVVLQLSVLMFLIPVSYKHLDVYKRQGNGQYKFRLQIGSFFG